MIVRDHSEHIGRTAVGAEQNKIVEIFILPDDPSLHLVFDDCLSLLRCTQADRIGHAGRGFFGVAVAPGTPEAEASAGVPGFLAGRGELFGRDVAAIGLAVAEQQIRRLSVACNAGTL